jgi:hypothetical protein
MLRLAEKSGRQVNATFNDSVIRVRGLVFGIDLYVLGIGRSGQS